MLYSTTTREVVSRLDLSRWYRLTSLVDRIKWWVLGLIGGVLLLIWLLSHWKDFSSLFQKCLMISILLHIVLLVIFFFKQIVTEISESTDPESVMVSMDVNNLAQEKLALDISEQVTDISEAPVDIVVEQVVDAVPQVDFVPAEIPVNQPIVEQSSEESFVAKVMPAAAREQEIEPSSTEAFKAMPELEISELNPAMTEFTPQEMTEPAEGREAFEPAVVQQNVTVEKLEPKSVAMKPVETAAAASDVLPESTNLLTVATSAADADAVTAAAGRESASEPVAVPSFAAAFEAMPEFEMNELNPAMKEFAPQEMTEPGRGREAFEPAVVQQEVAVKKLEPRRVEMKPIETAAAATDVLPESTNLLTVATSAADADAVSASAGRESTTESVATPSSAAAFEAMPELEMSELNPAMTEFAPQETTEPAGGREAFEPAVVQQEVAVEKLEPRRVEMKAVETAVAATDVQQETTAAEVASAADSDGEVMTKATGREAAGRLPELKGAADLIGLMIKADEEGMELVMNAPGKLDIPAASGANILPDILKNPGKLSQETIEGLGGNSDTQRAIASALDWFTDNQERDGRWSVSRHGGSQQHDIAGTSLALLCYYGWGAKHTEEGPYHDTVKQAIDWLVAQQKENGSLTGPADNGMYDHGMASIAICEAYSVTRDPALKEPATKAVEFIIKAQDAVDGGWRYQPNVGSDTSVLGWQYMALKSAELAGIPIPKKVFDEADRWLTKAGRGRHGGIYGYLLYQSDRNPAMIPTGMFCRQLAKVPPTDPRMKEGADYMRMHPINDKEIDFYYLYYGTLALYQHQGVAWEEWNKHMKELLPDIQIKRGRNNGSWDPPDKGYGKQMGRAVTTAIATLSLEVYYRILPIYGFRDTEETTQVDP